MKECKRCHRQLPETEFYKNISAKDGLQNWCKSCINDYDKNVRTFKEKNKNREGDLDAWFVNSPSGRFREFKERELEFLETNNIDWEQRRYEIAKDMMAAFLSNSCSNVYMGNPDEQAKCAVMFADALITELKKGGIK